MCFRVISQFDQKPISDHIWAARYSVLKLSRKGKPSIRLHSPMVVRRSQDRKFAANRQGFHFAESEKQVSLIAVSVSGPSCFLHFLWKLPF